ncbi:MAG: hypothetical protein LAT76_03390 [Schleiferiaceae bacterium]|nr:hypothetical protein [Schleiferiaceae bacterium]
MKTVFKLAVFGVLAIGISSCEELKKLADIEFGVPYEQVIPVNIETPTEADGSAVLSISQDIKLFELDGMDEYQDLIKNVSISKIQFMTSNVAAGAGADLSGALKIGEDITISIPSFEIAEGVLSDISEDAVAFDKISELMTNDKEINYTIDFSISEVPAAFDLKILMEFTVKASPLESL